MSDTDDTDDLLLIPPDFFVIESDAEDSVKPYGPYYEVVDNLITQVNQLEDRINFIETASDSSFLSNSIDYKGDSYNKATALMSGVRKFNSWDDIPKPEEIYIGSTHSTPQKPRAKIKLHSLPSTPSTDRYIPLRSQQNSLTSTIQYGQGDREYVPLLSHNVKQFLQNNAFNVGGRHGEPRQVQKAQSKMLNEIDNFISNVKTIQKHNAAKNLSTQFETCNLHENAETFQSKSGDSSSKPGLNLNDVDQMLHAMESQQREIESRLKEKEHALGVNSGNVRSNEHHCKQKVWQEGDDKNSVPDHDMGMRDILYDEQYKSYENYKAPVQEDFAKRFNVTALSSQEPSATDLSARVTSESIYGENSPSLSSSDSTQLTAYQSKTTQDIGRNPVNVSSDSEKIHTDAMHILNMHRNLLSRTSTSNQSLENENQKQRQIPHHFKKPNLHSFQSDLREAKSSNYEPSTKSALALLSLSELWNHNTAINDVRNYDQSKYLNKLQEEKLRRQHCEQLIQQLQTRILELQERLAVAVQVDQAKDDAIVSVHKSWEEAASKIDSVNNEKFLLEQQISELQGRTSFEISEAAKKVNHYENELSKALNLAHNNQEKLISLEKQNVYLTTEIQTFQSKLKTAQDSYNTELDSNQQLSKILSQKEIELNENKNTLSEARKEVAQSRRAVESCQAELNVIKNSHCQVEHELSEALESIKTLEIDKTKLFSDIEMHKKIEKSLQDDLNKQKDISEQNKVELRNFYQDQVEIVVRDKLGEFQSQLEKAENSLQDEIHSRELSIAKAAAVHIQQVMEKHALEVNLLEEKQKEEVKLYKLQLSQANQQIENLQIKCQQQQERRSNIAQQLHKVMEAQWLEALKIINNGKSPILSQDKGTNTIDQLNSLKSRSYNNLEEILFKDDTQGNRACGDFKIRKSKMPFFQSVESMSSIITDDTYDRILLPLNQTSSETPANSRPQKTRQQMENELQKYIQMLLSKSPGNPTDDQNSKYYEKFKNQLLDGSPDTGQQNNTEKLNPDGTKSNKMSARDRSGKPPWK